MIIENKTAVSFDLDMTLLDHRQNMRIQDSALETVEKIRSRYKIILATGRDMHTGNRKEFAEIVKNGKLKVRK